MADNEAPSKTILLERRDERALVREGKSVLEERRDMLAQEMIVELREATERHLRLLNDMDAAMLDLRQAVLRHGLGGLRRLAAMRSTHRTIAWRAGNYFGTPMIHSPPLDDAAPVEDRWDSSEDVARAVARFHALVASAARAAARLNNLTRLTREFRRTQRKVNALEHVVIPDLEQSIRKIEFALEEMERENMVRALGVKRRLDRR